MYICTSTAVCVTLSDNATCSTGSLSVDEGNTIDWNCQITARPSTNFSLVLNRKTILLPSTPLGDGGVECGREPQVIFSVEEYPQHVCLSRYRVSVVICSANESVVGEFRIVKRSGGVVVGTTVVVELIKDSRPGPGTSSLCGEHNITQQKGSGQTDI